MTNLGTRSRILVLSSFMLAFASAAQSAPSFSGQAQSFLEGCEKRLASSHARASNLDPLAPSTTIDEMRNFMNVEVIGQEAGVESLLNAIEVASANIQDPKKPFSRNLFTGPTGVGKSETVLSLVRKLGGNPDEHLIRIDCGEFTKGHEISRLIGATATYVGYGDKPALNADTLAKKQLALPLGNGSTRMVNVILIDEIEKCHEDVYKLLLGILDNGKATMGDNSETFFRNSIICATSNLGAIEAEAVINAKADKLRALNLTEGTPEQTDLTGRVDKALNAQLDSVYDQAVQDRFTPEFRNRWKAIIRYYHLSQDEHVRILQKQLASIQKTVFTSGLVKTGFVIDEDVRSWLIAKGTNVKDGARPMENLLDQVIRQPLARLMTTGQVKDGDIVLASRKDNQIVWNIIAEGLDRGELTKFASTAYAGYIKPDFNWEPDAVAGNKTPGQMTILELLRQPYGAKVLKKMYVSIPRDGIKMRQNSSTGPLEYTAKFARIDDQIIQIDYLGSTFKVGFVAELPAAIKTETVTLKVWKESEIREMLKAEEK